MFGLCCCTDEQETHQISFQYAINEHSAQVQPVEQNKTDGFAGYKIASAEATTVKVGDNTNSARSRQAASERDAKGSAAGGASAEGSSTSQNMSEKVRLQNLVNNFVKGAVKGCPCTYIKGDSGERVITQYRIDKSLEYLIILSNQGSSLAEVSCPIGTIQDIYSIVEDGEACFPPEVVSSLDPEERKLLLMVVFRRQGRMFRFCLLEESPDSRDVFLESLRILCIYGQSQPTGTET